MTPGRVFHIILTPVPGRKEKRCILPESTSGPRIRVHLCWQPEMSTDQHWIRTEAILAGSGVDRAAIFLKIGGSGLDRTEKIFVVLM